MDGVPVAFVCTTPFDAFGSGSSGQKHLGGSAGACFLQRLARHAAPIGAQRLEQCLH